MAFQIFLIAFALFGIVRAGKKYRSQQISRHWFMLWSLLWILVVAVALWPQVTDRVAGAVGVGRGADLLVYVSVVVLVYASFRTMTQLQKLHEEQTELVRRIAIDDAKLPDTGRQASDSSSKSGV